ncbi:MAG: hypothetical protein JRF33_10495 [Deltaproteobacteria bacterium]|nr:hypothetical protein [Deltaproteobacteria bacterium]
MLRNERHMMICSLAIILTAWVIFPACTDDVAGPVLCSVDEDCSDGQLCHHGVCRQECDGDSDCADEELCVSGACLMPCSSDEACPKGETCQSGYCQPEPQQTDGGDADAGGDHCVDEDNDGYGDFCVPGPDCDDHDRTIHPNANEICDDGKDNDCDGTTDEADCGCIPGDRIACYAGPLGTDGHAPCHPGVATCQTDRTFGPCLGEQLPHETEEISCNGIDDDCDGEVDENLTNRCGDCSPANDQLVEICANGIDDNCDGSVDENCDCDPQCLCTANECICRPPTDQPCYSGPPSTLGFGVCRGGIHDCVEQGDGSYSWTTCVGEVLPGTECITGPNGIDDDCDGFTDEGCLDDDGDGVSPPADCNDGDRNIYPGADEVCNTLDDNCNGIVDEGVSNACGGCGPVPTEVCGDGLDNDCDGAVDEGCGGCGASDTRDCYRGPAGTQGVGQCIWGIQVCDGEFWSQCTGDVLPDPEICDGIDNDCDDEIDEQWAIGANSCGYCDGTEICDGVDNDCDGFTDEGLRNYCGHCITCASDEDCVADTACDPAALVCSETACDGVDNDCDGLTDEGLLNACGTCGDSCYDQGWGGPGCADCEGSWADGSSDGVSNSQNPDELRLDSETINPHFIWIAGTGVACNAASDCVSNPACYSGETCHTVQKFDTRTAELIGVYSSWGWDPSRTAVAADNTVWVGHRGCATPLGSCDPSDPRHGNGTHLNADGELICRADVTGISSVAVRALTVDGDNNAWLGSWDKATMYQYSGSETEGTADGVPLCKHLQTVPMNTDGQSSHAYGAAVDGNGILWIATLGSGPIRAINTVNGNIVRTVPSSYQTYGMAIDANGVPWYGCWNGSCACGLLSVDLGSDTLVCHGRSVGNTAGGRTRGVAIDQTGSIWVAEWDKNVVSKFNASGVHTAQYGLSGLGVSPTGPLGMAIDFDDNIWAISYGSHHATKLDPNTGEVLANISVFTPYTYSDMTGYQLRTFTLRQGTWVADYDSGYADAIWDAVVWTGWVGTDDRIRIRVRSAASEGALVSSTYTNYYDSDVAIPNGPWVAHIAGQVPNNRWLQVEVTLTTEDDISPAFRGMEVFWQR